MARIRFDLSLISDPYKRSAVNGKNKRREKKCLPLKFVDFKLLTIGGSALNNQTRSRTPGCVG